jgi:tetratricopeptide (TPR) repeat protein
MASSSKLTLSETTAASALLVLCLTLAALLFARPRATPPDELPSLRLSERAVREVMVADAAAAQAAPDSPRARALEGLLMRHGEAEARGPEPAEDYNARLESLAGGYRQLVAEIGVASALRLRARNIQRIDAALELRLPEAEAKAVLGSMPRILALEGATHDGYLAAPRFVVRTLSKARWNLVHGLKPTHQFAPVELRAYYGWQALHSERLPLAQRIKALDGYIRAGGADAYEAYGTLLYRQGEYELALRALERAQRSNDSLRLRNNALAAIAAGEADAADVDAAPDAH